VNTQSSPIIQRIRNYYNILHDKQRLSVVGEVVSAVEGRLVRAGRLRQSVLRSAFEGRL